MLLFQKRFHEGLVRGDVTLTFRRWDKPHVKVGGRYRCHPIGVLEVDRVEHIRVSDIGDDDARRSGFESREALLAYMRSGPGGPLRATTRVYRVELRHGGDGDRVTLALDDQLDAAAIAEIEKRLARLDATTPWTRATLALIGKRPRVAASKLAVTLGRETLELKADIRKLKKLGLTQSFEVGYEIAPRGLAFLAATLRRRGRSAPRDRPSPRSPRPPAPRG